MLHYFTHMTLFELTFYFKDITKRDPIYSLVVVDFDPAQLLINFRDNSNNISFFKSIQEANFNESLVKKRFLDYLCISFLYYVSSLLFIKFWEYRIK